MGDGRGSASGVHRQAIADELERKAAGALSSAYAIEVSGFTERGYSDRSNPKTGWNHSVLWHHHDAVADEVIVSVKIRRLTFRRDYDPVGDTCVLVDDCTVDHAIAPDADRRLP